MSDDRFSRPPSPPEPPDVGPGAPDPEPPEPPDLHIEMPGDIDVQHCYRHPDRETGVSCSNCGRPICYDCMIPAAVGFRCPECMKEQNAGASRAKIVTRAETRSRWSATGGRTMVGSPVTRALLIANVAVFVLGFFLSAMGIALPRYGTLIGFGALRPADVVLGDEYWRLFTSMFLHAGIFHLLFNMWALYIAGGYLERVIGSVRFSLLYFISGFAGSALILAAAAPGSFTVGASGAIFGLFGALFAYAYMNRETDLMAQQLVRSLGFIIVLNLVITFTIRGISWQGHIGGLVGGAALMAALLYFGDRGLRGPLGRREISIFAVAIAALFGLVVAAIITLPI